ncbi:hypothetical protein M011DRAFT_18307 [Sporormia fimetaria CBS 119925]|uniref:Uncharacterized protein n=1 Tax=Sporormia fimetaria CBS 119925 TaxID=1340428 RepID=A0A6A6VQU8_9PLEO|nr:hypothetical protein M011DRAFT_18307 [Sporormia fimetaria CBS 119925]
MSIFVGCPTNFGQVVLAGRYMKPMTPAHRALEGAGSTPWGTHAGEHRKMVGSNVQARTQVVTGSEMHHAVHQAQISLASSSGKRASAPMSYRLAEKQLLPRTCSMPCSQTRDKRTVSPTAEGGSAYVHAHVRTCG